MHYIMIKRKTAKYYIAIIIATFSMPIKSSTNDANSDIVVIAKSLKTVRINYTPVGRHLRNCRITTSSGLPHVDRLMCKFVEACVSQGEIGREKTMMCVNQRISNITDGNVANYENSGQVARITNKTETELPTPDTEIIVNAKRNEVVSGRWLFVENGKYKSGTLDRNLAGRTWRACLKGEDTRDVLKIITNDGAIGSTAVRDSITSQCESWKISLTGEAVTGSRQCVSRTGRLTVKLSGKIQGKELYIRRDYKSVGGVRSQGFTDTVGTKIGEC